MDGATGAWDLQGFRNLTGQQDEALLVSSHNLAYKYRYHLVRGSLSQFVATFRSKRKPTMQP